MVLLFISKLMNKYGQAHQTAPFSPERETFRMLSLISFSHACLLQEENIPLHTVPNSIGICRQQTKFATFTLSLQNGKKFFIPLVYATLEFLLLYTTLKNQTFHFYEKSGFLLILVQMKKLICTLCPHSSNLNSVFSALLQHFQAELTFVVAFFGGFFIEGSCFFHIFRQSAKAFFVEVA